MQASYLYGIKCLQEGRKLSQVNSLLEEVQERFKERYPFNQDADNLEEASSPVITVAHLLKEIAVLNELGIKKINCNKSVYVRSVQVSRRAKADAAFLNSFYLEDLDLLINNAGAFGKGLDSYLGTTVKDKNRIDLLTNVNAFFQAINPSNIPAGRWPSNPAYGLYAAQVGAVNTSLGLLHEAGILGVNGPPGTGKTTLLSDIVADVIVMRAQMLIQKNVSRLFDKGNKLEKENGYAYYFPTNSEVFNDVGIVVASNNNSAVENISKELPDERKIDRTEFPDGGYFTEYSQNLIEGKSWGLLAAALGNAENRAAFKNNFWYRNGDHPGFAAFLQALYNNPEEEDRTTAYLELFEQTKTELESHLKEFDNFKKLAYEFYRLLPGFLEDQQIKVTVEHDIDQIQGCIKSFHNERRRLVERANILEKRITEIQYSIQLHQSIKPNFFFFQRIFKTKAFRKWNMPFRALLNEHAELSVQLIGLQKEIGNLDIEINNKENKRDQLKGQLKEIDHRISTFHGKRENLQRQYDIASKDIPDDKLLMAFEIDKNTFHKSNPWSSPAINKLRSEIFIKSLKLHEYAILKNAKQFKNNIGLLMELMDGKVVVGKDIALSLWQSFFFCIPVVSTSLASVGRLFSSLGKESIGWLLLDEAGQATPQSAAGIIYRAKRSVIIGDPLQIEPVVTVPGKLINILSQQYKIDSVWSPLKSSAQVLADRITTAGTWMKQDEGDDKIWAGFPLRAHRRCNNPMFAIANEIAYSNQMVKAMDDIPFDCVLGDSTWFDIHGTTIQNNHIVVEEILLLKEKLRLLGKIPQEIFVISPFKAVADRCKQEFQFIHSNVKCGTIHTFQGKEADIVFLVLGSNPARPGSRQWASQKPNMLNVAITRAKKRFFVIGSKKNWKGHNFFSVLARSL